MEGKHSWRVTRPGNSWEAKVKVAAKVEGDLLKLLAGRNSRITKKGRAGKGVTS